MLQGDHRLVRGRRVHYGAKRLTAKSIHGCALFWTNIGAWTYKVYAVQHAQHQKQAIFQRAFASKDAPFHYHMYDWLMEKRRTNELLSVGLPCILFSRQLVLPTFAGSIELRRGLFDA